MKYLYMIGLILLVYPCWSQSKDSVQVMKLFLKICSDYKTLPLRVKVDIVNSTNYLVDANDTTHVKALFCLRREGTYISFDGMEQIADDSLMLLVNGSMNKMLLYRHRNSVAQEMKAVMGWQTRDSSVNRLVTQFSISQALISADTAEIRLLGRTTLGPASLPIESIVMDYDPKTRQPFLIRQTRRGMIPLSEQEYEHRRSEHDARAELFVHTDSSWSMIRERSSVFRFKGVSHQENEPLPVTINDRIIADGMGNYRPIAGYKEFSLVKEF